MGYVYKYTNIITAKWYIGSHNGNNPKYSGSGLLFNKAKSKYGLDSFIKEILYEGDDFRNEEEKLLKECDAANDPMSYNMKNEALGGSFPGELNGMFGKTMTAEQRYKCGNGFRGKLRPEHSELMSGEGNPMFGKSAHTHGLAAYINECMGKTYEEIHGYEAANKLRKKLSDIHLGKKKTWNIVQCPHCDKIGRGPNMTRYHFNKCKKSFTNLSK